MLKREYDNKSLAKYYFEITSQGARDIWAYQKISELIAGLEEINLAEFYRKHENFDGLQVRGIGPKTKRILELLLTQGLESTSEIIRKERESKLSHSTITHSKLSRDQSGGKVRKGRTHF